MNRRQLMKATATAVPATLIARFAHGAELPPLAEDDPIAVALGYYADASQVDVAKYPKKAGPDGANQNCASCALYSPMGEAGGACGAIPGKMVAAGAWCNAWVPAA